MIVLLPLKKSTRKQANSTLADTVAKPGGRSYWLTAGVTPMPRIVATAVTVSRCVERRLTSLFKLVYESDQDAYQ